MVWNPATSYVGDWQWRDYIETADYEPPPGGSQADEVNGLKVKRYAASSPDVESTSIGLGLSAQDVLILVYPPDVDVPWQPHVGGRLIIEDGDTWIISRWSTDRLGRFTVGASKARVNADSA